MTESEETLLLIKGAISELNPEQLKNFQVAAEEVVEIVLRGEVGVLALAYIGAQLQLKMERESR